MKIKNQIIISLTLCALMILIGSSASATESAWQNLNPSFESGLSGTVSNCSPLTVSNGTVAAYPSCAITCNSGYTISGSSCVATGGGNTGGGGSSNTPSSVETVGSANGTVSMSISSAQTGNLTQSLTNGSTVELTVPQGAVSAQTSFSITAGYMTTSLTPTTATGAFLVGNQIFNINASSNNVAVHNFSSNLTVTLTIPTIMADTTNLGVYYFNEATNVWTLVPGAIFSAGEVTFQVNHLTKFAVLNIAGRPATVAVKTATTPNVVTPPPAAAPSSNAAFIALEKSLVKNLSKALATRLSGRILLQTESHGESWYVSPVNSLKYFLGRPADAFAIMRYLGLGITEKDYTTFSKSTASARLSGRILLRVQAHGEAYYVNPLDLKLYYMGRPADAFALMRKFGLGISNTNLRQIGVGEVK